MGRRDLRAHGWGEPARTRAGSGASAFAFAPRAFSLGRPGRRMSAAVHRRSKSLVAEATQRKKEWKRGEGLCEGGIRRPVNASRRVCMTTTSGYNEKH